ncbi:MAG: alpha/beta hydrolase [Proteobacteria bacterium]|nr:MAG: alpha/beta hydrolase [Pseudomonadota bacterium]
MVLPLIYQASGAKKNPLMLFVHGWPDNETLWQSQVAEFSSRYHCVAVRLPGFGPNEDINAGADFEELAARLHATVAETRQPGASLTLVGHDWGAYLSYLYEQRYGGVDRLITMDVGAEVKPSSVVHAGFLVSYQWYLIGAWALGKVAPPAGNFLSRLFAKAGGAPAADLTRSRMNYLYAHFWRQILSGTRALRPGYEPACPILFLYGADKKFLFHAPDWEKRINELPGSEAHGILGAGHWLMRDQPRLVNGLMEEWLRGEARCRKASSSR